MPSLTTLAPEGTAATGGRGPFALTVSSVPPCLEAPCSSRLLVRPRVLGNAFLLPFCLLALHCAPDAQGPGRPLPAYAGHATELFDDVIEPNAVGMTLDPGVDPRADKVLRERVQVGDSTMRVRVATVTAKDQDNGPRYVLGVNVVQQLAGQHPFGTTVELIVDPQTPSSGILKSLEGQIVGKTFVAFVREFVRPDGDHELHFHFGPDSKAELTAVSDAIALAAVK